MDDGSADTTARICGEYAKNIPIDCLFTRKIKACRACNAGFDVAQETYNF